MRGLGLACESTSLRSVSTRAKRQSVAMLSTKPRLYLGTLPLPPPPALPQVGLWAVLHEVRPSTRSS
jgi:hypothetical protein